MFSAKIILDSIAPNGKRLTTVEAKYPRFIHSEVLTHRDRARNSASSRAIPWSKMMIAIQENPMIPVLWGAEQKGMQTGEEIDNPKEADRVWLEARDNAVRSAQSLAALGVHKSICNRLTEPFVWITTLITATEWKNFFRLRCHHDAEIHFRTIAYMIREAMIQSTPEQKVVGEWHLPYTVPNDFEHDIEMVKKASVARCARVSYLLHSGKTDISKDLELCDKLLAGSGFGHMSPFEHIAQAASTLERSGPFVGWKQMRKEIQNECADG